MESGRKDGGVMDVNVLSERVILTRDANVGSKSDARCKSTTTVNLLVSDSYPG